MTDRSATQWPDWRPIETAPKWEKIICFDPMKLPLGLSLAVKIGILDHKREFPHDEEGMSFIPTHWLPLPEPPK